MMTVLIRGARVQDEASPFHGQSVDLLIDNGVITDIGPGLEYTADTVIAAEGLQVSRGWTDLFADYREPGYEHKETIATGLASAAAGGFTQVCVLPNTNPVAGSKSVIQYLIRQAEGHAVTLNPVGTISKDAEGHSLAEMMDMQAHGAVAFSDGWKPLQHPGLMLKALEYAKAFRGMLIQIPCDLALAGGGLMHEGPQSTRLGMPGIPVIAETLQLHRDIALLRYTGSRLHVTGISSAAAVAMIRDAKSEGLDLTCSVTPYHLALTDEALAGYDSVYKVMPPLRSEADRQALISGLADGTIDCIASHHRPQEWDAKAKEFEYASEGMNIQELTFAIAWEAVKGQVSEARLVDALSARPAAVAGLKHDAIGKGAKADLTLFTFSGTTQKQRLKSLSANHPFAGRRLPAAVVAIVNNKQVVINTNN